MKGLLISNKMIFSFGDELVIVMKQPVTTPGTITEQHTQAQFGRYNAQYITHSKQYARNQARRSGEIYFIIRSNHQSSSILYKNF